MVDVDAEARRTGRDRGDEHVAGAPGVLADDERAALADELVGRGPAEGVGERRLEIDVGDAADAVGPEEPRHVRAPPRRGPADGAAGGRRRRARRVDASADRLSTTRSGRPAGRRRHGTSWRRRRRGRPRRGRRVNARRIEPVEVGDRATDRDEDAVRRERVRRGPAARADEDAGRRRRCASPVTGRIVDRHADRCRRRATTPGGRASSTSASTRRRRAGHRDRRVSTLVSVGQLRRRRPSTVTIDRIDGDRRRLEAGGRRAR